MSIPQMYNHLIGLPLNPLGKQVKQVVRNFPYELGDCLIVSQIAYCTEWGKSYRVYRVEVYIETKKVYLDIITDTQPNFLSLGDNYCLADNWEISLKICDSLAIQQYMKEAF
jgi:hypothetical protein